ncbi:tyrosine-type recombinase/integrase [Chroococcus sp. FPU101]|uniref:tyrosine-type recombinase/integrase n=1 Tax=Chroococcus sp. FPU101 TaxID=1974212 RepID=UPI001A8FED54|nr:tyrosine-type recombinase/integrase [Chroococcus sp. FPU101]GFE70052.1 integrase family protein [Chroococcus sp. FPU101]
MSRKNQELNPPKRRKTSKGDVSVQVDKDRLRLYWRFQGKPCFLYLGLPDSKINRSVAQAKAHQITIDLATGNYDPTLEKYLPQSVYSPNKSTIWELYEKFWAWKSKTESITTQRSSGNYRYAIKLVLRYQKVDDLAVSGVSQDFVYGFVKWAKTKISHATLTTYLCLLKAIWDYAKLNPNPWNVTTKAQKLKTPPSPFTLDEVHRIIDAFHNHTTLFFYGDFVEFLLCSGMRIGEVAGLKWNHVREDCTQIWVSECLTKGQTRPAKSNSDRTINLSPRLTNMLLKRRSDYSHLSEYVFLSSRGLAIDSANFRQRWRKVLDSLGITYRKPYLTRKTFISHCLAKGMNPVDIAKMTGHDVAVLFKHYSGVIENLSLPDVF